MKSVCVLTSTRADYGILTPLITCFHQATNWELRLVVTGTHVVEKFGMTINEIQQDGFPIDAKFNILGDDDSPEGISCNMARMLQKFSSYLTKRRPDIAILLGDRYEIFSAAAALLNAQIPIAHLHGGELTQGAVDDCFRHSITKMSYLHFASTEVYRKRIIRLGESPDRVYAYGALGVENAKKISLMSCSELSASIGFDCSRPFAIVTFHPTTLELQDMKHQCQEVFAALEEYDKDLCYLVTNSNADVGGQRFNQWINEFVSNHAKRFKQVHSLGMRRYFSALHFARAVIGNSSSGILEAPSFHIPTVNIGNRQRGRIQAASVLNCPPQKSAIIQTVHRSQSEDMQKLCQTVKNPYEGIDTSQRIFHTIEEWLDKEKINLEKEFYEGNDF